MSKKFTKSLGEGALAGLGVGLILSIVLLLAGMEYVKVPIFVGGCVLIGYVVMASLDTR